MEIEDAAKEYAEINEDKAANSAHSYSKYDIADAYQQGYNLAVSRLKKEFNKNNNTMELVISALQRQIKLEEAKLEKRERMLATANQVVHSEPLQEANPEYIEQLKKAVHLLIWDIEALDCLIECQKHHQGVNSEIGYKIKRVIKKATPVL